MKQESFKLGDFKTSKSKRKVIEPAKMVKIMNIFDENDEQLELETFIINDIIQYVAPKNTSKIYYKLANKSKDEFEYMTNWSRLFEDLWSKIKWLRTFSSINQVAMLKILKKFMKNHFKLKDNVLKLQLQDYISKLSFVDSSELKILSRDIIVFYARAFCKDDVEQARQILN